MQQPNDKQIQCWQTELENGLRAMQMDLSAQQQTSLIRYLVLLSKWNRVFNLTAIRNPNEMVSRQLLDSLSILPWVQGPRVLDVGAGAGLPGIPLAIAKPDLTYVLLDSNGKKTRFMQQAVSELRLKQVNIVQNRVEAYQAAKFQTITSRAFADIHLMIEITQHLLAANGQWAAMKASTDELTPAKLPDGFQHEIIALQIPQQNAQRHLLRISSSQ